MDAQDFDARGVTAHPSDAGDAEVQVERFLTMVAHEDDDIGLVNISLINAIRREAFVQTMFFTSGNSGFPCLDYARSREEGIKEAYATVAEQENHWEEDAVIAAGRHVRRLRLVGTRISLLFLGLSDDESKPLTSLWSGRVDEIETWALDSRRPTETYTREQLNVTLVALLTDFAPTSVHINDASVIEPQFYPFDHPEHVHAGLFSMRALEDYGGHPALSMYTGYSIQFKPQNLPEDVAGPSWEMFLTYASHDPLMCDSLTTTICGVSSVCTPLSVVYTPMRGRQYPIGLVHGRGRLRAPDDRCLTHAANEVFTTACTDPVEEWELSADDSVRDASGANCLTAASSSHERAFLSPCQGASSQRFRLTERGQLRGPGASCAQQVADGLMLTDCADSDQQLRFELEW